jgi:divalent metal cation (Fe/Co/Zn/Cd) transporter
MLDAVDPALVDIAEQTLAETPGVRGVDTIRLRWVGHALIAESEPVRVKVFEAGWLGIY